MNLDRLATLLASGLKPANVASIIGCSPARISQIAKESEEFRNLVALKELEFQKDDVEETALSAKYHAAEHQLLDQVLAMAPVSELRDVTNALRVVAERQDKAKTRQNPAIQGQVVLNQVIQIAIPMHTLPEIAMTREREVIAIDNRNLAPLTSTGVTNLFQSLKKEKENELTRIPAPAKESFAEALSNETKDFLNSLHPAPYAESF